MAEKFIPSENPTLSLSVNQDNELVAPTAEELLSANPALGILQERTQNMSASPSGTSIEKGLTVSGNLQFSDSISNEPTEIEAPNTVQVKGYFIQYFDKTNFSNGTGTMDIYVGDSELSYEQGIENQSSPASTFYNAGLATQYEVGDLISFRNKHSFICGGQITAISGNKITLGQFTDFVLEEMPNTTTWLPDEGADQTELNFDAYSLWNMTRPTLGGVVLNNIAFAFGANLNSLGKASFAQGFDSNAYGAYSIAVGRGTTAGSYAQFVCGRNNSPDYNQKLLFIVGGGWGSGLKNVCTVDYGGNLVLAAGSYPQPSETASITATNGHFSGSIDVESSVSVGSVKLTEASLQETESNISNLQTDVQAIEVKTQNQSGSAGVTNFSGTTNLTNASVSGTLSVGSVDLTEESLQESQDNISALQTSVTSITSKTQNQSATSGNTSFTGNLTVSGTISTGSMPDIASNVSQNKSAISEIQSEISGIQTDVSTLALSKLPYGTLYFNSGKLSGSNFAVPTFPFSICATVRIDAWQSDSFAQTIFQCGDHGSSTDPWMALSFTDNSDNPRIRLLIALMIDGAQKTTEINCDVNLSEFLGKMHTIVGICRAVTAEALNWDIYIDGAKQNITSSLKNVVVSSLSGTRKWAVNTSNFNFSSQPASANPMMLRNLYIFNFDVSAEGSPYSIADYEAGRLIPPALKPSQVSLALENYTIERNTTTTLVKDTSGNSNDATVKGNVAGDNDQSIKVFVDEIKTQINQSNG